MINKFALKIPILKANTPTSTEESQISLRRPFRHIPHNLDIIKSNLAPTRNHLLLTFRFPIMSYPTHTKNILITPPNEGHPHILVVSINRPDVKNCVNKPTAMELFEAFKAFESDEEAWVAILTGEGSTTFSLPSFFLGLNCVEWDCRGQFLRWSRFKSISCKRSGTPTRSFNKHGGPRSDGNIAHAPLKTRHCGCKWVRSSRWTRIGLLDRYTCCGSFLLLWISLPSMNSSPCK